MAISNKMWLLGNEITSFCCIVDPDTNLLVLDNDCIALALAKLGIARKLTPYEIDYLTMRIHADYSLSDIQYDEVFGQLYDLLAKEDKGGLNLGILNIGLIGIFAFIGYKIISRKK